MPQIENLEEIPRRELVIFYVLDTSGSMEGEAIATLNRAIGDTLEELKKAATKNADAKLKIAVLEFNSGCRWITPTPEYIEDFVFEDLKAGGTTDVGDALKELNKKMSRKEFLESAIGQYFPVVIFMTDGASSDDYEKPLEDIKNNKWYRNAIKIGLALGNDPDVNMIAKVVGNPEAVVRTDNFAIFSKLLKMVSVTSSVIGSQSTTTTTAATGSTVVNKVLEELPPPPEKKNKNLFSYGSLMGSLMGDIDWDKESDDTDWEDEEKKDSNIVVVDPPEEDPKDLTGSSGGEIPENTMDFRNDVDGWGSDWQ